MRHSQHCLRWLAAVFPLCRKFWGCLSLGTGIALYYCRIAHAVSTGIVGRAASNHIWMHFLIGNWVKRQSGRFFGSQFRASPSATVPHCHQVRHIRYVITNYLDINNSSPLFGERHKITMLTKCESPIETFYPIGYVLFIILYTSIIDIVLLSSQPQTNDQKRLYKQPLSGTCKYICEWCCPHSRTNVSIN